MIVERLFLLDFSLCEFFHSAQHSLLWDTGKPGTGLQYFTHQQEQGWGQLFTMGQKYNKLHVYNRSITWLNNHCITSVEDTCKKIPCCRVEQTPVYLVEQTLLLHFTLWRDYCNGDITFISQLKQRNVPHNNNRKGKKFGHPNKTQ